MPIQTTPQRTYSAPHRLGAGLALGRSRVGSESCGGCSTIGNHLPLAINDPNRGRGDRADQRRRSNRSIWARLHPDDKRPAGLGGESQLTSLTIGQGNLGTGVARDRNLAVSANVKPQLTHGLSQKRLNRGRSAGPGRIRPAGNGNH